jgi:hypothetical protein
MEDFLEFVQLKSLLNACDPLTSVVTCFPCCPKMHPETRRRGSSPGASEAKLFVGGIPHFFRDPQLRNGVAIIECRKMRSIYPLTIPYLGLEAK